LAGVAGYILVRALIAPGVPYQAWTEAFQVAAGLLAYIVFSDLCNRRDAWKGVVFGLLIAAVAESMYALWLHWNELNVVLWLPRPESYGDRASGTYICPNHFAHLLQMALVTAVAVLATPGVKLPLKLLAGYSLVIGTPAAALSVSRSGVLGIFVGVGTVILLKFLRRGWKATLAAGVGLAGGGGVLFAGMWFGYQPFRTRMLEAMRGNIRFSQFWPDTWTMIREEGLFGVGPGVFRHAFEPYREAFSVSSIYMNYAHNEFLHVLAEYGWGMFLLMLGGLVWVMVRWLIRALREPEEGKAMIPITMLAVMSAGLVQAVFDFNFHITANGLVFLMVIGALDGRGVHAGVWKRTPVSMGVARLLPGMGAAAALLLFGFTVPLFLGSWAEYRMDKAINAHDAVAAAKASASMRRWTPIHWRGWTRLGYELRNEAFLMRDPEQRAGLISRSREAYEKALERNPYERIALAGLAALAEMEERYDLALDRWDTLERLAPYDVRVKIQKGLALKKLGRFQESREVFRNAARMRPGHRQIELNLRHLDQLLKRESEGN